MRIDTDLLIPGLGEPRANVSVTIDDGSISYVGPQEGAPGSADTTVPVLMPGLWECHGHFEGFGASTSLESDASTPVAQKAARATADIARTLAGGVTSVREVGGHGIDIRHAIRDGSIPGPTIYAAGRILSTTGGHADVHGLPERWLDSATDRIGIVADGVPEVLKAVRSQLRRGADLIKICASGGVMSELDNPIHQQFGGDELRAIVEEAGRAERVVAAHCHGKAGIMAALEAGVTTIEHGTYLDSEAADAMLETGAILVPTRMVVAVGMSMEGQIPDYAFQKMTVVAEAHKEALALAVSKGVSISMGTDIFFSGPLYGQNSQEIMHMIDAGMTDLDAIASATAHGPRTLGLQAPQSGQIKTGFDADMIALATNPLVDRSVWGKPDRVTHVWKAGELVKG